MSFDFNILEKSAQAHIGNGEYNKALAIYFFMADGDPSLDAGYLGAQIGKCYELLGELYTAKYWFGRAVEENPEVRTECIVKRKQMEALKIDAFVISK